MISRRILTVSLLIAVVSGYFYFTEHVAVCLWLMVIAMLIALCGYIFFHQINWWWYQRYPPALPLEMQKMYARFSDFYRSLDAADRRKFETRARLFVEAKEFIAQGDKEVAEDVKYMIACYAVMISLHREEYLFDPYHRIVVYLHPFLTPNFPDQVHTYELEHEDGTVIFALEQLVAGFFNPGKYYQTGLHAFAALYTFIHGHDRVTDWPDAVWQELAEIGGWSRQQIEDFIGLPQPDPSPVLIHHWFVHREKMRITAPDLFKKAELLLT